MNQAKELLKKLTPKEITAIRTIIYEQELRKGKKMIQISHQLADQLFYLTKRLADRYNDNDNDNDNDRQEDAEDSENITILDYDYVIHECLKAFKTLNTDLFELLPIEQEIEIDS